MHWRHRLVIGLTVTALAASVGTPAAFAQSAASERLSEVAELQTLQDAAPPADAPVVVDTPQGEASVGDAYATSTPSSGDVQRKQACAAVQGQQALCFSQSDEQVVTPEIVRSQAAQAKAAGSGIQPVPDWCVEKENLGRIYRFQQCLMIQESMTVVEMVDGKEKTTGGMTFLAYAMEYSSKDSETWAGQMQVQPSIITGTAAGITLTGKASCSGNTCEAVEQSFQAGKAVKGKVLDGESYWRWPPVANSYALGLAKWDITFTTARGASDKWSYASNPIRCDNAVPGVSKPGCIMYKGYAGIKYTSATTFTKHVKAAQQSGLPGALENSKWLHRTTNTQIQTLNRNKACPASLPRPKGMSCDEYPFASTMEGAYLSGGAGRTFSWCNVKLSGAPSTGAKGYSVCMINAAENSQAGSWLNSVTFVPQRVIQDDAFYVQITV